MPGQEIRSEICGLAIEAVPGVPEAAPTRLFPFRSLLTPDTEYDEPDVSTGSYEALDDSTLIYEAAGLDGDGPADTLTFPYFMLATMDGSIVPTTPSGATLARLWQGQPTTIGNNQKTFTVWTGDPNIALFRGAFGVCTGWELASGEGRGSGSTFSASIMTQGMTAITTPISIPAKVKARKMRPLWMEAWIDNLTQGGSIGVTPVHQQAGIPGNIIAATHTLELQREAKQLPAGPNSNQTYSEIGRGTQQMNSKIKFHFKNLTYFNQWKADDLIAIRVRHNGDPIEANRRHYIEIDNYGKWREFGWADFATTNRALELTLRGLLNPTIGSSFAARCQTTLASV